MSRLGKDAERDALVSEQSSLEHQLTGRTTELTASSSGYFSEVVDGYESILTPSSLDEMTVEQFDKTAAQRTCGRRDRRAAAFLHLLGQLLDRQRDDLIQLCDV